MTQATTRGGFLEASLPVDEIGTEDPDYVQELVQYEVRRWLEKLIDDGLLNKEALQSTVHVAVSRKRGKPYVSLADGVRRETPGDINYTGMVYLYCECPEVYFVLLGMTKSGRWVRESTGKKSWADDSELFKIVPTFEPVLENEEKKMKLKFQFLDPKIDECDVKPSGKVYKSSPDILRSSVLPVPLPGSSYEVYVQETLEMVKKFATVKTHGGKSYPIVELVDAGPWEIAGEKKVRTLPPKGSKKLRVLFAPGSHDAAYANHFCKEIMFVGCDYGQSDEEYVIFFSREGVEVVQERPQRQIERAKGPETNVRVEALKQAMRPSPKRETPKKTTDDGWNIV